VWSITQTHKDIT